MIDNTPQKGRRFSHVYLDRGAPVSDSSRFRRRVTAFLYECSDRYRSFDLTRLARLIHLEIGLKVPPTGYGGYDYHKFLEDISVVDFLDCITLFWRFAKRGSGEKCADAWRAFVDRTMKEENIGYRIDEGGGVHFQPDEEFARNRSATLESLKGKRYEAILDAFESSVANLNRRDYKSAIRSSVEAAEILLKLISGEKKVSRLGPAEIEKTLKPLVQEFYKENSPAQKTANSLLNSFGDWVTAAQSYRHGQITDGPAPPPVEVAVAMVSLGSAFLRWLASLDHLRGISR